jgi:hypothetical protein
MDMVIKRASALEPGDSLVSHDVEVTVLGYPEMHKDLFGRPEQRVWARREDTAEEGYLLYGLGAHIEVSP